MNMQTPASARFEHWVYDRPIVGPVEIWAILSCLAERGHGLTTLLRDARLEGLLVDPQRTWSLLGQVAVHRAASAVADEALFVDVGRRLHLPAYGAPGLAIMSSATLESALGELVRFAPLLGFKGPIRLGRPGQVLLEPFADVDAGVAAQFLALDLAKLVTFLRDLLGSDAVLQRIWAGALPPSARAALADYANVEVVDAAGEEGGLSLDARLLDRALGQANPEAHRRALEASRSLETAWRTRVDLRFQVLDRLRRLDVLVPGSAEIATALHMSDRTLRRRLEKLGTSFSAILDERRKQLAQRLLREGVTVEVIAERLGYRDVANFRQAFKRWTGEAPSLFRAGQMESVAWAATQPYPPPTQARVAAVG